MIGQSLGRYTIESQLGEGGMGVVYKARDTQLGRTVAIKILPADKLADAERKRRFVQEAKAASALNHPNIITIHDFGSDAGRDFMVMEYVAGTTLDRRIPANGLPMKQALTFAAAIANALATAHAAGIIHRDLKPANIMITDAGGVKVLDFGVAKLLEPSDPSAPTTTLALTEAGTTVGTPAYMSPEQAEGRPLDGRSDIFGFGSVLYEMVTGRRAFDGESRLSVLAKILNEEPAPPSRLTAAVPPELEKTILRCLRKDPARRFQTMADLKVALDDLVSDTSVASQRPVPARSFPISRRWALVAAAPVVAGAVYFALNSWRASPPPSEPLQALPLTSLPGVFRHPSLSPDGNHVAFSWTGPKDDNPDIWVQQIGAGSPIRLTTDSGNDYSPSWSPDGLAVAFLRRLPDGSGSELRLVPPLGGTERKLADVRPNAASYRPLSLAWCPDSTCVLVTDSPGDGTPDAAFLIARDTGEKRQLTHPPTRLGTAGHPAVDSDPTMSPDGRSLIFRRDATPFSGEFYRLALKDHAVPDGQPVRLTSTLSAGRPVWMPDSREILFAARGGLWRLDTFGGGTPARLPFVGQDGLAPVVARLADGRLRLVYVRSFVDQNLWRVDTSVAGAPASSPPVPAISTTRADYIPSLSPNGLQVAFFSSRSGDHELWVASPDGSNAVQLTTLGITPGFAQWSPDGKKIVFHGDPDGRADILAVPAGGGRPENLTAKTPGGAFPSFSRDGRGIYISVFTNGEGRIWKMAASGGAAMPVTNNSGTISIESTDGHDLYYTEAAERPSALWRLPLGGGAPVKVLDGGVLGSFDVIDRGIYYIDQASGEAGAFFSDQPGGETRLRFFDFSTRRATTVAHNLGRIGAGLSASRDGRTVFFTRVDSSVDELMLVENFR